MTGTTAMHQIRALKTAYTRLPVLARYLPTTPTTTPQGKLNHDHEHDGN